jgi:hypothetical protein
MHCFGQKDTFTVLGLQPNECEPSYEVWASRVHPDDLAEAEAKYQQAIADKKGVSP